MYYGNIKKCDVANGVGIRTTLFVSGCLNHCEGCFQPQTWDFKYGELFTKEIEDELIESVKPDYVDGITILGGEPFEPENQRVLVPFIERFKKKNPTKSVWCFSGFTLEELKTDGVRGRCEVTDKFLSLLDVLIDGRFVLAKRNLSLQFRGSENQRVIDMKKTRETGKVVLWQE